MAEQGISPTPPMTADIGTRVLITPGARLFSCVTPTVQSPKASRQRRGVAAPGAAGSAEVDRAPSRRPGIGFLVPRETALIAHRRREPTAAVSVLRKKEDRKQGKSRISRPAADASQSGGATAALQRVTEVPPLRYRYSIASSVLASKMCILSMLKASSRSSPTAAPLRGSTRATNSSLSATRKR